MTGSLVNNDAFEYKSNRYVFLDRRVYSNAGYVLTIGLLRQSSSSFSM